MPTTPKAIFAFDGRPYLYLCDEGCRFAIVVRDCDLTRIHESTPMDRIDCPNCFSRATLVDLVEDAADDDPTP